MNHHRESSSRRFLRWWSEYQLPIILLAALIALALGLIGFTRHGQASGEPRSLLDNIYLTLGLLSLNTGAVDPPVPLELEIARFLVPLLAAYTAVVALAAVFTQQAQLVRLRYYRDHIIICGLGRKGFRLAIQFAGQGERVVVIEPDEGNDWIETVRAAGVIVVPGDATDPVMMRKVRLDRARYLIAVSGSDGINAEVAVRAQQFSASREDGVLTCVIHIVDPRLWHLLREKELYIDPASKFRLELFNVYDRGAHLMLEAHSPWLREQTPAGRPDRLVIVGLGKLGESLILQAALRWQQWERTGQKLYFSIVDLAAEEKVRSLCIRYPHLEDICHFDPLQINVHSAVFHQADFLAPVRENDHSSAIYVCMDDDALVLHIGLILYQKVRETRVPVVVRMAEDAGLALLITGSDNGGQNYETLFPFPLLDQTCTPALVLHGTHEIIARALHASYLEGIKSQQPVLWEDLSDDAREWNRKQADRISLILEKNGYRIAPLTDWKASELKFEESQGLDEIGIMAEMEHAMWCEQMQLAGWRYASSRSIDRKTNPSLVPWDELPASEVEKNRKFIRQLPRILALAGFQIERKNSGSG